MIRIHIPTTLSLVISYYLAIDKFDNKFAFIVITTVMDYEITNIFETCRGKM